MDIKIFRSDKRKLVLFAFFSIVVYFGMIQTWAFCEECSPKPFLYDAVVSFPFWSLWIYLSLPIQIMSSFFSFQGAVSFLVNLLYFYVVSCFMIYSFEQFGKEFSKKIIGVWAIIFIALNLYNLVILPWLSSLSGEQIFVSAIQPSLLETIGFYLVEFISFVFYAYLVSSIFFAAKNKLKKSKPEGMSPAKFLS